MTDQPDLFSDRQKIAAFTQKMQRLMANTPAELTAMRYLMSDGIERGFAFGTLDDETRDVLNEYGIPTKSTFSHLVRMQRAASALVRTGELVEHVNQLGEQTGGGWVPSYQNAKYADPNRGTEPWWHVPDDLIESDMQHIPKGGMCRTCIHRGRDCSNLPFKDMRVISKCKDVSIVRCTEYQREEQESES